jgi:AAA family ATPase
LTKPKDSPVEALPASREPAKKTSRRRGLEFPSSRRVVVRDVGYPFRLKGDPKQMGLEVDNEDLFTDYAREQWMGSVVRRGLYLFDRYIIPDYAFQVIDADPEESIITKGTKIVLESRLESEVDQVSSMIALADVVGHESVKRKCRLILEYLTNPSKFGEWAPRAVLFHGPPGTGKTLTAQAMASEANARIFLAKASDLIGVHVGDGGRRINSLFENARSRAPSIIFIDELDAIGLARSFQSIRGDVSEVVTALLGELDRTNEDSGVVVVGATNALALIDPAIRNRFDSVFEFGLPNLEEREKILQMYSHRLPIPFEADIRELAAKTDGFSGRDLRDRILKEALHYAISEGESAISNDVVQEILSKLKVPRRPEYSI